MNKCQLQRAVYCGALLLAMGCKGGDNLGTVPVTGIVTLDGQPVAGAVIAFSAAGGAGTTGSQFSSYTDDDGSFSMKYSKSVEGLQPGEYRVTVRSIADLNPGGRGIAPPSLTPGSPGAPTASAPKQIPEKYRSFDQSGLTASVQSGEKNHFSFDLQSQ